MVVKQKKGFAKNCVRLGVGNFVMTKLSEAAAAGGASYFGFVTDAHNTGR